MYRQGCFRRALLIGLLGLASLGCSPTGGQVEDAGVDADVADLTDAGGDADADAQPPECAATPDCLPYEDGNLCNGTLVCDQHRCVVDAATVVVCDTGQDTVCRTNRCAPASGSCAMTDVADSTPCDRGDGCSTGASCSQGLCAGGLETCCTDGVDNDGDGVADCIDADCAGVPECIGECAAVPEPEPVSDSPLPGEASAGSFEPSAGSGFSDHYVYNQAGELKIGVREEWGGSIVFFGMSDGSPGMNASNVIDANDTGREVQVAFYDPDRIMQGCAWDASCQSSPTTCPNSITYLGWNPVQGGNRCNNGSGVESVTEADGAITVSTLPLFWNPNWSDSDCDSGGCSDPLLSVLQSDVRVIQRIRFVRYHVVELEYTIMELGGLSHASTAQEFPTIYTGNGIQGPNLLRLFNSDGQEIAIDTPGNDGFYYENFTSPGGWVTMQNASLDYGVGHYTENRLASWQGWQQLSLPFNNFRPIFPFGIPAGGVIRARSYLIIGSKSTVTTEAQWLDDNLPPFGVLDAPTPDETVSGQVTVRGWALDNKGVAAVELLIDGAVAGALTYGTSRADVQAVWPGYTGGAAVGYEGTLDTGTLSRCPHLLEILAWDTDGNSRVIARRRIFVTW